MDNLS
jgi:hypothetical protein